MFKLIAKYTREYKWFTILSPILTIFSVLTEIAIPFLMTQMVDVGIVNRDVDYVVRMGIYMILLALFGIATGALSAWTGSVAGYGMGANTRDALYAKIQELSFGQLDKLTIASLITRVTSDVTIISQVTMMSLRMAVRSPVMLVSALIAAISIDAKLAGLFVMFIPVLIIVVGIVMFRARKLFREMQDRVDSVNDIVNEDLTSIKVIKSFVREEHEETKFKVSNDDLREAAVKANNLMVLLMPLMFLIIYGATVVILWFGGLDVMDGRLGAGAITGLITYCMQIYFSLIMFSMYLMNYTRANASAKRVQEVLDLEPDLTSPENGGIKEVSNGSVDFNNVSFKYPINSENSLHNIDIHIESGETVGVIGSTGSAKSTLVQLIPRLYDTSEGEVLVGGVNVKDYNLEVLREEVAFVLQQNTLFSGTIRSNMLWGDENASDERIIEALKNAQAWEFVEKLPGQLDATVEQGGSNFSGGQKQRLTIARALVMEPKVIILDDSTSAVDMATDAQLRAAFRRNLGEVTTFIIAQRINSIQDADTIIVMEEGRIDAMGSHDELVESNQIYQDLYETQVKGAIAE